MTVLEERLQTPVTDSYDIAVCGGGFAGIAAALAALRQGKKTVLLEQQYMLGGLGTAGIVTIYLPLCDGYGRQVSFGIAEELLRLSVSCGAEGKFPKNWLSSDGPRGEKDPRFEVQYNPHLFAALAEGLLRREGAEILYGTSVTGVKREGNRITHLITESRSGRQALAVKAVADTTGDCVVAHLAGVPTAVHGRGNVLSGWYYSVGRDGYQLHMLSDPLYDDSAERFAALSSKEVSEMMILSRRKIFEDFIERRADDQSFWPVTTASIPQLRMTRKLQGEYTLSDQEVHKFFGDSVGMVSDWRKRGPVYEVPFRTLWNRETVNLAAAGRCTSVTDDMWDIMRVIPCCAVTGEAAGTALALADDLSALDIKKLQQKLRENGVVLHETELLPKPPEQ